VREQQPCAVVEAVRAEQAVPGREAKRAREVGHRDDRVVERGEERFAARSRLRRCGARGSGTVASAHRGAR
jgi:hypothetical protein